MVLSPVGASADLGPLTRRVQQVLQGRPQSADELAVAVGAAVREVLTALSLLEIRGLAERSASGRYEASG